MGGERLDPAVFRYHRGGRNALTVHKDVDEWHEERLTEQEQIDAMRALAARATAPVPREEPKVFTAPQRTNFPQINTYAMGKGDYAMNPIPRVRVDYQRM